MHIPSQELIKAAANVEVGKVQNLLSTDNVNVNAIRDERKYAKVTALLEANGAGGQHEERAAITRMLIDAGANVDAQEALGGKSALHHAALHNRPEIINMLAEAKADL